MLGSLGWQELLIIFAILALLFGASRVASLGGALGRGIREFRSEASGAKTDDAAENTTADTAATKPNNDTPRT
jgi:sec-independent protein translocase protein TatA